MMKSENTNDISNTVMGLSEDALEAKRAYSRKLWKRHRDGEPIAETTRERTEQELEKLKKRRAWAKKNRDKCREYERRHWEKVALLQAGKS